MTHQTDLIESFGTTTWLATKFADGMSHEQSTAPPPFRANSFNWVLGHIVVGRDRALDALDATRALDERERVIYETGSKPVSATTALDLERLIEALEQTQDALQRALSMTSDEQMQAIFDADKGVTVGQRLEGLHWHETYHLGQLEILRQVGAEREPFP